MRWPKGTWMKLRSGAILRAQMEYKDLSERTVAHYAQCSRAMIGHLLHERKTTCSPELAVRIAGAIGVSIDTLFEPKVPTATVQNISKPVSRSAA